MTVPLTEGEKEVALLFADILASFDESRHRHYDMFDGDTWTPGCHVCAMGAVIETLVPEDVLRTTPSFQEGLYDALFDAIQDRLGPMDRIDMTWAFKETVHANDANLDYTFEKIAAYLRREAGA
jgi:hypothetical protein